MIVKANDDLPNIIADQDMPIMVISSNDRADFSRPVNWVDWPLGREERTGGPVREDQHGNEHKNPYGNSVI